MEFATQSNFGFLQGNQKKLRISSEKCSQKAQTLIECAWTVRKKLRKSSEKESVGHDTLKSVLACIRRAPSVKNEDN
jgi:hypothetical protein